MGELKIRIKNKYDTEANWVKNDPVLLVGETAYSSDKSGKYKVGDGTHKWSELSYAKANLTKSDVTTALGYTPPTSNTWRGIQNNLTSTATDQSLSAAQGKILNDATFQKQNSIDASVDWDTIKTFGSYKVQMTAWGDASTKHGPNTYNTSVYSFGLLLVFRAYDADTENRTVQIYIPHKADVNVSSTTLIRMFNGSTWQAWHPIARGTNWSDIINKPSTFAPSSHTHDDRYYTETEINTKLAGYFPLSGGTMSGTAMISWSDSGNWSKNNADVTFPVNRGGLSWSGQSDGIQLYAVETGNDNLELYLKFTDDNSNGLSIRNKSNVQTARIAADGTITAESFIGNLTGTASAAPWSGITGKPATYPPSSHTHNYAGSSSSGGIAWNASSLYLNPQTRQTSANYDLTNSNTYAYRVNYSLATSAMTTGKPPADGHILTFGWDTDAGWGAQLCIGDAKDNHLYLRGSSSLKDSNNKNSSSWENWKTVLDSTNYTSYAATKGHTHDLSTMINTLTTGDVAPHDNDYYISQFIGGGTTTTTYHRRPHSALWTYIKGKADSVYCPKSHTHNYAGSSSAGGVANSAAKLATARTVSGGTDITMSFNYDGSGNSSASIGYYNCSASKGNTNNYPFHRFAKLDTITGSYADKVTTFLITQDYIGGGFGIVRVSLRTENTGSVSKGEIKWLVRSGIAADSVQMGLYNVFGSTYADLFFKSSGTYTGTVFRAITNGARGSVSRTWILINSGEVSNTTTSDKKTSTEVYTSVASAATALHNKAYSTTVSGVDAGAVSWSGSANRVADANNSNSISLAYSKSGMKYNEYTWLAGWNGYELRAVDKSQFATAGHTHNYAGSSSAGGNANAAVKLATARSINGTNFDGSGNITTANWGTARTITVGNTGKSVNGSGNVSWSLGEIGIHVSKTVPTASDGKNGDIWIVYE